jgi:predicted ATP-grasp superfamily ATP-dependent carboligase
MYCTGLGIARNLGRYGIPVVGISSCSDAPGNVSRYCRSIVGPDSQTEPDALARLLIDLGKLERQRGILFPTRDADVVFVNQYRDSLEPFFAIPQPTGDILHLIVNKARLASVADSVGIPVPRTMQVSSLEEILCRRDDLIFPAVLKPIYAYQWRVPEIVCAVGKRKGIKVGTIDELMDIYRRIVPYQKEILIQEFVQGPEDEFFIVGSYFNHNSECLGSYTAQKIVQFPSEIGLGCLLRSTRNEEVRRLGNRLLKSIKFTGIAEIEFKKESKTGEYRLIEINPRHWDQHALGTACGVNLTYTAYLDLCTSLNPTAISQQAFTCYWVRGADLAASLVEIIVTRKGNVFRLVSLFIRLLRDRKVFALWDWQDPKPFWRHVLRWARI